jgi:hypothetical protein
MAKEKLSLGESLVAEGVVTAEQLKKAEKELKGAASSNDERVQQLLKENQDLKEKGDTT